MARKKAEPLPAGTADEKWDREAPLLTLHHRIRLVGQLSIDDGTPVLTTRKAIAWVITPLTDLARFIGQRVMIEGIKTSMDGIEVDRVERP